MFGRKRGAALPRAYRLGAGSERLVDENLLAATGMSARTLARHGALEVTLVALERSGLAPHRAAGPIGIHVLSGELQLRVGDVVTPLAAGDYLALAAGVEHEVLSAGSARFLLTLADPGECRCG